MADSTYAKKCTHDKKTYGNGKDHVRNFLKETLNIMEQHDLTPEDVSWVGDVAGSVCMTWAEFERNIKGFEYLPRGRCGFMTATKKDTNVSYYPDEGGLMNRIPVDLVIVGNDWMMRRFIHMRVTEDDAPRKKGGIYDESAEFWEFLSFPKRNTSYLVDGQNDVKLFATDKINMARKLYALNTGKSDDDDALVRAEEFERNQLKVRRKSKGSRRIGGNI